MCAAANDVRIGACVATSPEGAPHAAGVVMQHRPRCHTVARIVTVATAFALLGCAGATASKAPAAPALTGASTATVSPASEKAAGTDITASSSAQATT